MKDLAHSRKVDPNKYNKGLLCKEMRLPGVGEDIISMGLKAGYAALVKGNINPKSIDALFVGTETMTYAVKSVSNIFAELLGISAHSMTQDVYNACAGGTLAILNAIALIEKGMLKKVLIICADISSYDIGSPSEPTQGAGAIAFVLTKNPRVAVFSKSFGMVSGNANDFYRLRGEKNARVFGKYSLESYLNFQMNAYDDLLKNIGDFHADYYSFHAPYAKMPIKMMQQIILKRWARHIKNITKLRKKQEGRSLMKKLDYFLHDVTVLPEYIYLKLRAKGYSSERLENIAHWFISNIKGKVLPHLRVPYHFGNMYNASVWAQIIYILESYGRASETIYFGSYGSGATSLSGLLKIQPSFKSVVEKRPKITDYIKIKEKRSVKEYESIKNGHSKLEYNLGFVSEHQDNDGRGFTLNFCDNGCLIPHIENLNHCPKGHPGFYTRFFPLYATLQSSPLNKNVNRISYLKQGLVRIAPNIKIGADLEYEIRRVNVDTQICDNYGLIDWAPMYFLAKVIY